MGGTRSGKAAELAPVQESFANGRAERLPWGAETSRRVRDSIHQVVGDFAHPSFNLAPEDSASATRHGRLSPAWLHHGWIFRAMRSPMRGRGFAS
jgi:hypothetical protein